MFGDTRRVSLSSFLSLHSFQHCSCHFSKQLSHVSRRRVCERGCLTLPCESRRFSPRESVFPARHTRESETNSPSMTSYPSQRWHRQDIPLPLLISNGSVWSDRGIESFYPSSRLAESTVNRRNHHATYVREKEGKTKLISELVLKYKKFFLSFSQTKQKSPVQVGGMTISSVYCRLGQAWINGEVRPSKGSFHRENCISRQTKL